MYSHVEVSIVIAGYKTWYPVVDLWSMSSCRITLVRHGETFWNREGIYQGHMDVEGCQLTPEGGLEATKLGERFKAEQRTFSHLISSDLGRAFTTAANINLALGLTHTTDARLRERALGKFEGQHREEANKILGSAATGGVAIDEGETAEDVQNRALAAIESIVCDNLGANVLVVSHGGTISLLLKKFLGLGLDAPCHFKVQNTSVSVVDCWPRETATDGEARMDVIVTTFGDVAHLLQ